METFLIISLIILHFVLAYCIIVFPQVWKIHKLHGKRIKTIKLFNITAEIRSLTNNPINMLNLENALEKTSDRKIKEEKRNHQKALLEELKKEHKKSV